MPIYLPRATLSFRHLYTYMHAPHMITGAKSLIWMRAPEAAFAAAVKSISLCRQREPLRRAR